jgi:chromosome segregation ATPase
MLVSRTAHNEKVQYHKLTDKALPIDDPSNTNHLETNEIEIDPLAPKGNLLLLPQNVSVFGVRSSISNDGNQLVTSVDNQRAMKQLEISNKIQTGLELKIDTLKKEVQKLTDELHSTQKSSRSYSDQLSDTKKRLRDTQHELKELEEKYKRYSDALYRVRSESRSTVDHLTHVLGIKEKQPSQTRKSEDDTKKKEKPVEQEPITKAEGKHLSLQ